MPESFGTRLRRRREAHAIRLETIAEQTKIKRSLLEALERDDVSQWPAGIFRRAYIRAYACAIGLDPDVVVREFLEVHPEQPEIVDPLSVIVALQAGRPPRRAFGHILESAAGALSRLRGRPVAEAPGVADPRAVAGSGVEGNRMGGDTAVAQGQAAAESRGMTGRRLVAESDSAATDVAIENDVINSAHALVGRILLAETPTEDSNPAARERASAEELQPADPDFLAVAHVCTELGRAGDTSDVQRLVPEMARALHSAGLIVWVWDPLSSELRAALVHGYSSKVLAQLPPVAPDSDNATAAAFRLARPCSVRGRASTSAALTVPLVTPGGCAGVLAIELQPGCEPTVAVLAAATILAAVLAQLVADPRAADDLPPRADASRQLLLNLR